MLYTKEAVMDSAGKLQTLEEFVKGSSGGGSIGDWELLGTIENLNFNVPTKITGDLLELFSDNDFTEVLIQADYHGTDLQCPIDNIITLPQNLLDLWYITVTASFTVSLPNDTPQTTAPGYFKFYKDSDNYYVLYRGASFFQTNLLLTIKVYVR